VGREEEEERAVRPDRGQRRLVEEPKEEVVAGNLGRGAAAAVPRRAWGAEEGVEAERRVSRLEPERAWA
jgi:hypothetical protein